MPSIGELINTGRTAEVFAYGSDKVLKLFRAGFPEEAIAMEYGVGLRINDCGLRVPTTFDRIAYQGRSGIVFERIRGESLIRLLAKKPWGLFRFAKIMAETHAAVHTIRPIGVPSLTDRMEKWIQLVTTLSEQQKKNVIRYMRTLRDDAILCHGDFHPDNIVIDREGPIVIDWMTAAIGNPAADVARTKLLFEIAELPEDKTGLEKFVTKLLRRLFLRIYLKHYQHATGMTSKEIHSWYLPVAAARLYEWAPPSERESILSLIKTELRSM